MIQTFSGGGVVVNKQGLILAVSQHGTSWSLPKGHIDPGEDAKTAARREIAEESGITRLNFIKKLGSYDRSKIARDGGQDKSERKTITIFLYTTDEQDLKPLDPENPEARWVAPDQVAGLLTHPKDQTFYKSVQPAVINFIQTSIS